MVGNGQPGELAPCQLYRHTFVLYYHERLISKVFGYGTLLLATLC